jgi:hypothetical protein
MLRLGRSMRHPIAAIVVAAVVVAVGAATASAGTYTVLSCRDRAGARVPLSDDAGGWSGGSTGGLGLDAMDYCDSPSRGFFATVSGTWPHPVGSMAWWRFVPPPGTLVEGADIYYSGYTRPYDGYTRGIILLGGPETGDVAHHWGEGDVPVRWFSRRSLHESWFQATAECDSGSTIRDCPGGTNNAWIEIYRAEMLLSDGIPPTAGSPTGSGVASSAWQGTQRFAFPAVDQGGGVYQAILDVDGTTALVRSIDAWGGRCVDTTRGERVFRYPRPCPTSVDALVPVDANTLPAGEHDVTLRISDAAGNLRTVYSARKTIVAPARRIGPGSDPAERGAPNGENATDAARLSARWTRTKRATLVGPYGRRQVIRGRLTDRGGAGIRGARIELLTSIDGRQGPPIDKGGARTRGDGRFTLIVPRNVSSRTLVLRYRSHANDTVSIAEKSLRLRVKAAVKLAVRPKVAARGRTVRLTGRLVSGPLPRGGKVVELQARSPGERWITFRTVRATRTGRFTTHYTFRRGGPALYLMRARVRAAADYPYATGASHAARVRVR